MKRHRSKEGGEEKKEWKETEEKREGSERLKRRERVVGG